MVGLRSVQRKQGAHWQATSLAGRGREAWDLALGPCGGGSAAAHHVWRALSQWEKTDEGPMSGNSLETARALGTTLWSLAHQRVAGQMREKRNAQGQNQGGRLEHARCGGRRAARGRVEEDNKRRVEGMGHTTTSVGVWGGGRTVTNNEGP
ncbi:hypothetical protein ERJ75_000574900 [Trypanosoma vivax]|nr:hypothetical protein ERJ75_000574900 [Trypanosoma vivax]